MRGLLFGLFLGFSAACSSELETDTGKNDPVEPVDVDGDGFPAEEDCNDEDAAIFPGAEERCDTVDNDCDGEVDEEAVDAMTLYVDKDGDGFGDVDSPTKSCELAFGYVEDSTDCDDARFAVNPAATEVCDNEDMDEDCDGLVEDADDSASEETKVLYYRDNDTDGYGDVLDEGTLLCDPPVMSSVSMSNDDCNDADFAINPAAKEICDAWNVDENCNGLADDEDAEVDATTETLFYVDRDSDGYGDMADLGSGYCDNPSITDAVYSENNTDCDDASDEVNPGMNELCDGIDNDCMAATGEDGVITLSDPSTGAKANYAYTGSLSAPMDLITATDIDINLCKGTYYLGLEFAHDSVVTGLTGDPKDVIISGGDLDATVLNLATDGIAVTVSNVTMKDGVGDGDYDTGTAVAGGGVFCDAASDLTLDNVILRDNTAYFGGAIASVGCDLTLQSVAIHSNESQTDSVANGLGSAVFATSGTIIVENSIIYDNVGGLVSTLAFPAWDGDLTLEMTDVEVYNNASPDASVLGSVYVEGDGSVTVDVSFDDVMVSDNTAPDLTSGHTGVHTYGALTLDWTGTTTTESGAYNNVVTGLIVGEEVSFTADTVDFGVAGSADDNESSDVFSADATAGVGIYWVEDNRSFVCNGGYCGDDTDGDGDPSNDVAGYPLGNPSTASTSSSEGMYRSVIVQVTEHTTLESFDAYLGAGSTCTVDFYLLGALDEDADGRSDDETWSVWYSLTGVAGTATSTTGTWQNSGRIGSFIAPQYEDSTGVMRDTYVALGYGWDCSGSDTALYGYETISTVDAGIGSAVGYQFDNSYDTILPYSSISSVSGLTMSDAATTTPGFIW
jgi:hypothetical protein